MGTPHAVQRLRQVFADRLVASQLAFWVVLSLADVLSLCIGFIRQGTREVVPLCAWLYSCFPFILGALVKLLVTALIALYCCWQYSRWRTGGDVLLAAGVIVLALPVIYNLAGLVLVGSR